jgi:L-aminopeptidase/D-esterase-like protein
VTDPTSCASGSQATFPERDLSPVVQAGPTNSLVDVAGLRVGHAQRVGDGYRTGTTVVLAPPGGMVAGVDVRGAAPGTRETELLDPRNLVERIHAIVLTGGSAYGLSAACGVMARLADAGVGFPVEGGVVPIVPAAVIYDLGRGGHFRAVPDGDLGAAAYDAANQALTTASPHDAPSRETRGAPSRETRGAPSRETRGAPSRETRGAPSRETSATSDGNSPGTSVTVHGSSPEALSPSQEPLTPYGGSVDVGGESAQAGGSRGGGISASAGGRVAPWASGSVGAGTGAVAGGLAGGIGTASVVLPSGVTVAALAVVNAAGSVLDPRGGRLAGTRYGLPGEFDHLREPSDDEVAAWRPASVTSFNTTIGVVATDLTLTKAQCGKLAGVAHDGLARAIRPAHTMVDGDTIFAVATCALPSPEATPVFGSTVGPSAPERVLPTGGGVPGNAVPSDGGGSRGVAGLQDVLAAGADVFSRAVAHAVLAATGREGAPAYRDVFPSALGEFRDVD